MKYYTEDHEWVEIIGETATIGISQFAIEEYGEVSSIELPEEGDDFIIGDRLCNMETDRYTVELCAPIGGSVAAVNEALEDEPELMNERVTWSIKKIYRGRRVGSEPYSIQGSLTCEKICR